jgi:hypothetical protein
MAERSFRDLTGSKFGRLTVLEVHHRTANKRWWLCACDCGTEKIVRSDGLTGGDNVSCGCKKIDQLRIHGGTGTPEHKAWSAMIERCHTTSHPMFSSYGARGIYVCQEWRASFQNFLRYIGSRPTRLHSLDRIDNDDGYRPGNVRWATKKEQANNRRMPRPRNSQRAA